MSSSSALIDTISEAQPPAAKAGAAPSALALTNPRGGLEDDRDLPR